jgi:Glycosyl transferase family 2/Glycosyl transferases group 1
VVVDRRRDPTDPMTSTRGRVAKDVAVFVAGTGNGFMTDIAQWLVEAAAATGRTATLVTDRLPHDPRLANLVVAPHELYALCGADPAAVDVAVRISVPVCTEQPGTTWFQTSVSLCRPAPLALDINAHGVEALARQQVSARRLLLGAVPSMSGPTVARDLDVLFLGADTARRRRELSALGPVLSERRADLRMFRFTTPVGPGVPGLAFGPEKYALLARAKLLVNVHRDDRRAGYFEWARMVEAMANGCVVVTEPCAGFEPLRSGIEFVETDDLASTVQALLDDPTSREAIASAARDAVGTRFPLHETLRPILDCIDGIEVAVPRRRPSRRASVVAAPPPVLREFRPAAASRERVFRALVAEQRHRRGIEAVRAELRFGSADHVTEHATSAWSRRSPEVSVVVTLYDYATVVVETLDSILASRDVSLEIVIVDDHSRDGGRAVVRRYLAEHDDVPIALLGREANRGLSAARNLGIAHARADKIMIMDADNLLYPVCLRRLADALDADAGAAFAYATLEAFGHDPGLRSELDWFAPWLCESNYIDAQAMVRASTFARHGGYLVGDEWEYGWEDWDLWLRLAAAGEHGVHVREMLGRYRTQPRSMIGVTTLAPDLLRQDMITRHPGLPWP